MEPLFRTAKVAVNKDIKVLVYEIFVGAHEHKLRRNVLTLSMLVKPHLWYIKKNMVSVAPAMGRKLLFLSLTAQTRPCVPVAQERQRSTICSHLSNSAVINGSVNRVCGGH